MKLLIVILVALSLELPVGVVTTALAAPADHDALPVQIPAEEASDAAELQCLIDMWVLGAGSPVVHVPVLVVFQPATAPFCKASRPERDSHFCRPPPTCT